jgi:uncharacterized protein (TIGR03084 family)
MLPQAEDFRAECRAIHALIAPLGTAAFDQPTAFKGWSVNDVLGHLHMWNWAADLALANPEGFLAFRERVGSAVTSGRGFRGFEKDWRGALDGRALADAWINFAEAMADRFAKADASARVAWVGPPMSVRSSITARQMESWAHAQAIYDAMDVERADTDRLRNIAVLGVNTYAWTFRNRQWPVPEPQPFVRLIAPSGAVWDFGDPHEEERIEGSATEFCQTVTQTRNIADTGLNVRGANARLWMDNAQCFAGPPHPPPAPGTRRRQGVLNIG